MTVRNPHRMDAPRLDEPRVRRFKWKRYVVLAVLLAIFLYTIITGGIAMRYAGEVIHPPLDPAPVIKENIAIPYSSASFRSGDADESALVLHGWHFPSDDGVSAVIIVHGFGGNRFPFGQETLDLVEGFLDAGYGSLVFDLRNSGDAEAGVSTFGLRERYDVLGAVEYMRGQGYTNIVLYGVSTGANAAAAAASMTATDEVGALILDSPVADMREFVMYKIRQMNPELPEFPYHTEIPMMTGLYLNGDVTDADIGVCLEDFVPRPVLLIHGSNDEIVSNIAVKAVYDDYLSRAVGRISMFDLQGAGHAGCFSYAKPEYLDRVAAFLTRAFD